MQHLSELFLLHCDCISLEYGQQDAFQCKRDLNVRQKINVLHPHWKITYIFSYKPYTKQHSSSWRLEGHQVQKLCSSAQLWSGRYGAAKHACSKSASVFQWKDPQFGLWTILNLTTALFCTHWMYIAFPLSTLWSQCKSLLLTQWDSG